MAIITRSRLTELTETKLGTRTFSDTLTESDRQSKLYATTSVFISHSHHDLDKADFKKVKVLLRGLGVSIYIDSMDPSMPPFTNAETANLLKQKIKDNKKFLFLATNNAINSKWCNWELGFGDAQKYIDKIALFPLSENYIQWTGNEYLKIYPRIEENSNRQEYYEVIYPNGSKISLLDWLKSN